jgi:hypothetical protein
MISTPPWPSTFGNAFGPLVKARRGADEVGPLLEGGAVGELRVFEVLDGSEVLVDQCGVGQRPEVLGGVSFGRGGRQKQQVRAIRFLETAR